MIEGWEETEFSEMLVEGKISYGIVQPGPDVETDFVPILRVQDIKDGRINPSDPKLVSKEVEAKYTKTRLQGGELLITVVGSIGECAVVPAEIAGFNVARAVSVANIKPDFDTHFVKYAFSTPDVVFQMYGNTNDTVQATLNLKELKALRIAHPDLPEQRAIAGVLSSLDDKIDFLHRQNTTLGALAETLFRQRFVEEAQDDWEECSLIDAIQLLGGGTPQTKKSEYWNGDIPWLSCGDVSAKHRSFVSQSEKSISLVGLENSSARLLPANATVVTARGTVGKFALLAKPMAFSQSNYGVIPAQRFEECFFFTYLLINHSIAELQSTAYGSVFDTITARSFEAISLRLPKSDAVKEFEGQVAPYFEKMRSNTAQIEKLGELRNRLLPKLMSGQTRLSEFANA